MFRCPSLASYLLILFMINGLSMVRSGPDCSKSADPETFRAHARCLGVQLPGVGVLERASAPVVQPLQFGRRVHLRSLQEMPVQAPDVNASFAKQILTSHVTFIVKHMSKYRAEMMGRLHASIRKFYPDAKLLVGDDTSFNLTSVPAWAADPNTDLIALPPDCGLALGRNILVQRVDTPYFVLLDDDYLFTEHTRIEALLATMLNNPGTAVVGGGLQDDSDPRGYASYGLDITTLDLDTGTVEFSESVSPFGHPGGVRACDAVVNFFLGNTSVFKAVRWQPPLKMGEHEIFFLSLKLQGFKVLEQPSVHVYHDLKRRSADYATHSHRAQIKMFAGPACEASPGLNVLRSLWWSIVCDHQVFCNRDPTDPSARVQCRDAINGTGRRFWQDTRPNILTHGEELLPAVPPKKTKSVHADIFVMVITHQDAAAKRDAFRAHFRKMAHMSMSTPRAWSFGDEVTVASGTMAGKRGVVAHDSTLSSSAFRPAPAQSRVEVMYLLRLEGEARVSRHWFRGSELTPTYPDQRKYDRVKVPVVRYKFFVGNKDAHSRCDDWCKGDSRPWSVKCAWTTGACAVCAECPRAEKFHQELAREDVQILDCTDSYKNLVNKVTAAMRWTSMNVQADYVVKLDDDVFLNPQMLFTRLKQIHFPTVRLYAGNVVTPGWPVVRDKWHKWYLPKSQYPMWGSPRYNNGPCYVVSLDVAAYLGRYQAITARFPFNLEDMFVGIALTDIDVYARSIYSPEVRRHDGIREPMTENPFLLHLQNKKKYNIGTMWKTIAVHPIKHPAASFPILSLLAATHREKTSKYQYHASNLHLLRLRKIESQAMDEVDSLNAWAQKVAGKDG